MQLIQIDPEIHLHHRNLEPGTVCYFLREYAARQGYGSNETNQLIKNLKKCPRTSNAGELHFKGKAIEQCATELLKAAGSKWLSQFTLVPVPPSKIRGHPEFDHRMLSVLRKIDEFGQFDVRDLIIQTQSIEKFHHGARLSVPQLVALYEIDQRHVLPEPTSILICDDVLTNGTHFRAAKQLLQSAFGPIDVQGLFVSRCVHMEPDEAGLFGMQS